MKKLQQQAMAAHRRGQLDEAIILYRRVLEREPGNVSALANLASVHARQGSYPQALACYQNALESDSAGAEVWYNYGNLQQRMGMMADALQSFEYAVRLKPDLYQARFNLANLLRDQGQTAEAIEQYRAALAIKPDLNAAKAALDKLLGPVRPMGDAARLRQQGDALYRAGDVEGALAVYQEARRLAPEDAGTCNALGVALQALGRPVEAEDAWRHCIRLDPEHVEAHANLGTLYRMKKRHEDALRHLRIALSNRSSDTETQVSLAYTLLDLGAVSEADELVELGLRAHPRHFGLLNLKAFALVHQARIREAQELLAQARALQPDHRLAASNALFSSLYADYLDAAALTRLHKELAHGISEKVARCAARPVGRGGRPLRIGYLSPDFRSHPVGFFIEPVLQHHHPERVHVTCYALPYAADATTERLKRHAHRWRDLDGMKLDDIAAQIQRDGIDILVDLAGYTAGGSPDLMASKAAPVQALFIGYPYTSGMEAVDYLIADRHVVPLEREGLYSEKIARLDHSFLCYHPAFATPDVAPLPALANGCITFGSYNNLPKLSETCLRLWTKVLQAVPGSRLALMAQGLADGGVRALFRRRFEALGIGGERLLLLPPVTPFTRFLAEYGRIDIALDPIPFNGGTTSCDALWMGVPVVTLAGEGFFGRMGVSLLNTIDRREWIAESEDDYVRIAAALAADVPALAEVRASLRQRVMDSGLYDAAGYTARLEALYAEMAMSAECEESGMLSMGNPKIEVC